MNTMKAQPVAVIESGDLLGEGVLWDADTQSLWWTDIAGRRLHLLDWTTRNHRIFDTPERLGSFALTDREGVLLAAFETGIARYAPDSRQLDWLDRPLQLGSGIRFNDGRTDRSGRFWAGTMRERGAATTANGILYSFDLQHGLRAHVHDVQISNSICFSPDGRQSYWADSARRRIYTAALDSAAGSLGPVSVFADTTPGASPDGANFDASGRIWSAQWGGSRVVCYSPEGDIERALPLPVSQPTCIAFGGPDMNLLFVTSARDELSDAELAQQPLAGHLFVYQTDVRGVSDARFILGTN
jgi:L-arabinonolactonase